MIVGYYELWGNTVYYDGAVAHDIDANEEVDPLLLLVVGEFIGEELP